MSGPFPERTDGKYKKRQTGQKKRGVHRVTKKVPKAIVRRKNANQKGQRGTQKWKK
jgi:hypothetical protein